MAPLFLLFLTIAGARVAATPARRKGRKCEGLRIFQRVQRKGKQKIAHEIYATPLHIGGGTGHRVLADADAAVQNLINLYEQIDAQGWKESRIKDVVVCLASESLAFVDTQYSRLDDNGTPIPPTLRTNLYVLQKLDGDWRIVAFYSHDSDKRPGCEPTE